MTPDRLGATSLASLPATVAVPAYDRRAIGTGIVHLGPGAFHRGHQAVYTDTALAQGDRAWGILGASLRSGSTRKALAPQDGLYTVAVRDGDGTALRVIGSVQDVLVASPDPAALIARMAEPGVRIVSLTVTEKGYCHDPAGGALREDHPDILHDLASPDRPRSAPGTIVAALARRRRAGHAPFTVLSCDNLPANGRTLKRVLTRFAELVDPDLGRYVHGEVACPSTMVDRIVPATTDADRALVARGLGLSDAWPVMTEPFSQWVIEDDFPLGRPDWAAAGAELVADVGPYETMKLRLLNGAHSAMAYLGQLAGLETVADVMARQGLARFVAALMEDVTPTLAVPPGADVAAYKRALLARFRNPALRHRTAQIAMDGSQKLPQRLLAPIRDLLAMGAPIDRPALGVAAWMRCVAGTDEHGRLVDVRDPLAEELRRRIATAGLEAQPMVATLLELEAVFGADLPRDPRFRAALTSALARLLTRGAAAVVG